MKFVAVSNFKIQFLWPGEAGAPCKNRRARREDRGEGEGEENKKGKRRKKGKRTLGKKRRAQREGRIGAREKLRGEKDRYKLSPLSASRLV